jgi:hypothetical protein
MTVCATNQIRTMATMMMNMMQGTHGNASEVPIQFFGRQRRRSYDRIDVGDGVEGGSRGALSLQVNGASNAPEPSHPPLHDRESGTEEQSPGNTPTRAASVGTASSPPPSPAAMAQIMMDAMKARTHTAPTAASHDEDGEECDADDGDALASTATPGRGRGRGRGGAGHGAGRGAAPGPVPATTATPGRGRGRGGAGRGAGRGAGHGRGGAMKRPASKSLQLGCKRCRGNTVSGCDSCRNPNFMGWRGNHDEWLRFGYK